MKSYRVVFPMWFALNVEAQSERSALNKALLKFQSINTEINQIFNDNPDEDLYAYGKPKLFLSDEEILIDDR